ncbi:hypothetical protein [Paenibacillus faecalis]|uniref:hypothetical protein n=1 Tax=Paenibacillus faecalis TaxID=2079532 RepID=UPI000D105BEB|nr:hypothetical protein [Paenibacillus faecalis]
MSRRKRKGSRFLLAFFIFIMIAAGAGIWYIAPTKTMDLTYRSIDIKDKLISMIENRQLEMTLSEEEVVQMSKKNLVQYLNTHELGVDITGADFHMNGAVMTADMNGKWGVLPFGVTLEFHMTSSGSRIILEHQQTKVRSLDIPLSIFKLDPIEISLKDYTPDMVTVKDVEFLQEGMKLTFKIDWMSVPSLW